MDIPAVCLLLFEQGNRSLKDHTRDLLDLACLTHYLDHLFCIFFNTSLNKWSMARLPVEGLKGSFTKYVQFTLAPLRTQSPARR